MLNWIPPELAPKDGTQILAVFTSYPFPVMAVWCGASGTWCAAVPQVDLYDGEMNDWYFENEHFPAEHLKVWEDVMHNKVVQARRTSDSENVTASKPSPATEG